MPTQKQEYIQFLKENFNGLSIRQPLFYNWDSSLRFNLQEGETNTDHYFTEVVRRATTLFEAIFEPSDTIFFVLMDFRWKRRKIRTSNYSFKQIKNLRKDQITFSKVKHLYEISDKLDIWNIAITKTTVQEINYTNLLTALAHSDFPSRQPRLDNKGVSTGKEIYFLNIDKKIIFQMYDDRGLDIIANRMESLQPIYKRYTNWLLDYDREKMDKVFNKSSRV